MKVKIFDGDMSTYELERQVNKWIEKHSIKVINISMTCYSQIGEYYMAILYEE